MTFLFVIEDGTGRDDANALASVAFVDDYHASRGNAGWTAEASLAISAVTHADDTLTRVAHGLSVDSGPFMVASTDSLPGGLDAALAYWVAAIPTADTLKLATEPGGTAIALTDAGSGTITLIPITAKAAAIVRASDFVESTYRGRLKGCRNTAEQAFHYPATGVYDSDGDALTGVPTDIKKAVAELALAARTSTLGGGSGPSVIAESRVDGDITRTTRYAAPTTPGSSTRYPAAQRWLQSLLKPIRAVRA